MQVAGKFDTYGTAYEPNQQELMDLPIAKELTDNAFGGMTIQIGWCNGYNTMLNALEYHKNSELNVSTEDFILLLARRADLENGILNTEKVKAFFCPAGTLVELYAATLHYAPCSAALNKGFRVAVVLPKGTNLARPDIAVKNSEDKLLWARNKWLLAHRDSAEVAQGAQIMLEGENIDVSELWMKI